MRRWNISPECFTWGTILGFVLILVFFMVWDHNRYSEARLERMVGACEECEADPFCLQSSDQAILCRYARRKLGVSDAD